jgi:alkaline phosphatase D
MDAFAEDEDSLDSHSLFGAGIASSAPRPSAVVLWTRLVRAPAQADGEVPDATEVRWEISLEKDFKSNIASGVVTTKAELAHSVHVLVEHLPTNRWLWYRFTARGEVSPTGRTRAFNADQSKPASRIQFASVSCQHFKQGYFTGLRRAVELGAEFILHLGDYIYTTEWGSVRNHSNPGEPTCIDDFRRRHLTYKQDSDLRFAQRNVPFFCVPDNHDAVVDRSANPQLRAAAYQAWYEHTPMLPRAGMVFDQLDIFFTLRVGSLFELHVLDTRQFRAKQEICIPVPELGFGQYRIRCAEAFDEGRSMLGEVQEQWLSNALAECTATWTAVASSVIFCPLTIRHDDADHFYVSGWDFYPQCRDRVMTWAKGHAPLVVLSGDLHSHLLSSYDDNESARVVEFSTTSLTSNWPSELDQPIRESLPRNPHVRLYDSSRRGFILHTVTASDWRARYYSLLDVSKQTSRAVLMATASITDVSSPSGPETQRRLTLRMS